MRSGWLKRGLSVLFWLSIASCGGGGGGDDDTSSSSPNPPQPPASPPVTTAAASRFLVQASFGPSPATINQVAAAGLEDSFLSQLSEPATLYMPAVKALEANGNLHPSSAINSFWDSAAGGRDQLRQRMVYALSQILVISAEDGFLQGQPVSQAYYMDILSRNAFGNYRDLLEEITYSPTMGVYLTYIRNEKGDPARGNMPDENYAREIMQLFTIGLVELNNDGTRRAGDIETYDQDDVTGLARVFTGLSHPGGFAERNAAANAYEVPMIIYDNAHSELEKSFLGLTIPAGTDAATSIDMALDHLFEHPNVGPFIGRQLSQRFVTSNPEPAYVGRVATAFNTGEYLLPNGQRVGAGRRGDLTAPLAAVLFDQNARRDPDLAPNTFGKVREPVLRFLHWARALEIADPNSRNESLLDDTTGQSSFAQHPFRADSVFNFYRPNFVAPGSDTAAQDLVSPELGIVHEASAIGYMNMMMQFTTLRTPNWNQNLSGFDPDYTELMAVADDIDELLSQLTFVLTHGELSNTTRQRIVSMLEETPIRTTPNEEIQTRRRRVQLAIFMIVTSPDFAIQR